MKEFPEFMRIGKGRSVRIPPGGRYCTIGRTFELAFMLNGRVDGGESTSP